jgi:hypothetical protein
MIVRNSLVTDNLDIVQSLSFCTRVALLSKEMFRKLVEFLHHSYGTTEPLFSKLSCDSFDRNRNVLSFEPQILV